MNTIGKVAFDTPLAIPPLAASTVDAQGRRVFELTAQEGASSFVPGGKSRTMGYNGNYLGPTLVAERGEKVLVKLHNGLPVPTTVHWHGMHLPAKADGGPHQTIEPGGERSPSWTIDQQAGQMVVSVRSCGFRGNATGPAWRMRSASDSAMVVVPPERLSPQTSGAHEDSVRADGACGERLRPR